MSKKQAKPAENRFRVRVVYGFLKKLRIVILGDIEEGQVKAGMQLVTELGKELGSWEIEEVLKMDFINNHENQKFIGLQLICKSEQDFNLLKSLRVYDEIVHIR